MDENEVQVGWPVNFLLFLIGRTAFLAILLISTFSAKASYDELLEVASQFNEKKGKIESLEKEKRELLRKVYVLEKETRKVLRTRKKYEKEKLDLEFKILKKSKEIASTENLTKEVAVEIQSLDIGLGFFRDSSWVDILSRSKSPQEVEEFQAIWQFLGVEESKMIESYLARISKLETEKESLKDLVKIAIENRKKIAGVEKNISEKHFERKKIVNLLEKKLAKIKNQYSRTKSKGLNIIQSKGFSEMKLLFSSSFYEKRGKLSWPFMGFVTQKFGLLRKPLNENIKIQSNGIKIVGSKTFEVTAVARGRVKSINTVSGLGSVVILAHGDNYYSVYGNLSGVNLKIGQIIEEKKSLGKTRKSGLYFEIRHFSDPQNPEKWLKKNSVDNMALFNMHQGKNI